MVFGIELVAAVPLLEGKLDKLVDLWKCPLMLTQAWAPQEDGIYECNGSVLKVRIKRARKDSMHQESISLDSSSTPREVYFENVHTVMCSESLRIPV